MLISPHIEAQLAEQRGRGLRAAVAQRPTRRFAPSEDLPVVPAGEIVIRHALPSDRKALAYLAEVDSKRLLRGDVLLAEVAGEPRAALSLDEGTVVADPFQPTAALVSLLAVRAHQLAA
jgi:hypothetical protein